MILQIFRWLLRVNWIHTPSTLGPSPLLLSPRARPSSLASAIKLSHLPSSIGSGEIRCLSHSAVSQTNSERLEAVFEVSDKDLFKGFIVCILGTQVKTETCSKEERKIKSSYSKKYLLEDYQSRILRIHPPEVSASCLVDVFVSPPGGSRYLEG